VTDTGEVRNLLDAAQALRPEAEDRKRLLIELARRGVAALQAESESTESAALRRRAAQRRALADARDRFDAAVLLGDDAWR
jgi:hypothetical protein